MPLTIYVRATILLTFASVQPAFGQAYVSLTPGPLIAPAVNGVANPSVCGGSSPPTWCSGSDMGGWINEAFTVSATVQLPPSTSCVAYAIPIVIPSGGNLTGGGGNGSPQGCLEYTTTSASTALTINPNGSLSNLNLVGPGAATSPTGIIIQGSNVIVSHVNVSQFGLGLTFGNNSYIDNFDELTLDNNGQSLLYSNTLASSGSAINFYGGAIATNGTFAYNCAQIGTSAIISFYGTSFGNCGIDQTGSFGGGAIVNIFGGTLETYISSLPYTALPQITHDTSCNFCVTATQGVLWLEDGKTSRSAMFQAKGDASHFVSDGDTLDTQEALPEFALDSGSNDSAEVFGLGYVGYPYIPTTTFSGAWVNGLTLENAEAIFNSGHVGIGNSAPTNPLTVGAFPTCCYNTPIMAAFYSVSDSANILMVSRGGVSYPYQLELGVSQSSGYTSIQSAQGGVGSKPLVLEPNGGDTLIDTTTDCGQPLCVGSVSAIPVQKAMLASAYTNATASATTIMSFSVAASTSYALHCHGLYKAAASGYFGFTLSGPASPGLATYDFDKATTIASNAVTYLDYPATGTSYPAGIGETAVTTAATDMPWDLTVGFTNGSAAGTLAVQGLTVASDALTVEAGSWCQLQ